ncbi:RNA polymerase sigma factor [Lacinutrix salivirga]
MKLDQLIKACKKKNIKAQKELYETYKDALFCLCLKYCKNKEEAEDNLQDTFIEVFKNIKRYNGKGSFEGWLKRITINKAIDKYKKESYINIVINDAILKDQTIETSPINLPLHTILNLVQNLPSRYRMVFNLYELDNYTHKEIASLLSISEGTSKSNLHRAKTILKDKIEQINFSETKKNNQNGY